MANPRKVLDFLDVAGNWDPSLLLVMGGAVAVTLAAFRPLVKLRRITFPEEIDLRLAAGAAIFGIGWGIAGFCPGPAVASLTLGVGPTLLFVITMVAGMVAHDHLVRRLIPARPMKGARP